jgi:hypothetical protein
MLLGFQFVAALGKKLCKKKKKIKRFGGMFPMGSQQVPQFFKWVLSTCSQ